MMGIQMDWASTLLGRGKIRKMARLAKNHPRIVGMGAMTVGGGAAYGYNQRGRSSVTRGLRGRSSATRGLSGRSSGGMM